RSRERPRAGHGVGRRARPELVGRGPAVGAPRSRRRPQPPRRAPWRRAGGARGSAAEGRVKRWILAARPATLTAAVVPVAVGTACAHAIGALRIGPALAALFGAVWIQIGTNFANDVFDAEKGVDTAERLGPTRAVAAGLVSAAEMRVAMIVAFALATLAG